MNSTSQPGHLYIVATPLGNLEDLSPRARAVLESSARIACEDTRRTGRLLSRFGITTPTVSCHKFNERQRLEQLLRTVSEGQDVALVSDGGTPGISDPGALLVQAALDRRLAVVPIPGPSAVTAMLSASGLPADRFRFDGFLPHRSGERRRRLRELREDTVTLVLLETPHRIREALGDLQEIFGERTLVLGRELSKLHETILRGTPSTLLEALGDDEIRGEITLVVAGASGNAAPVEPAAERTTAAWNRALERCGGDTRAALRAAARELGMKRAELYRQLVELGLE